MPAQALLVVAPSDSRLEIEALVPNRDIGFVQSGQLHAVTADVRTVLTGNYCGTTILCWRSLSPGQSSMSMEC